MLHPTERPPASLAPRFAASINPGPPPVMTVKPRRAKRLAGAPGHRVVGVAVAEPRRAEHGHARAEEVEAAKALEELAEDADRARELEAAGLRALEELADLGRGLALAPVGALADCRW